MGKLIGMGYGAEQSAHDYGPPKTNKVWKHYNEDPSDWDGFLQARDTGEQFECTEAMYDYWWGVLPPVFMGKRFEFEDGQTVSAHFGFAEGYEAITVFWQEGGRYFGRRSQMMNPYA